MTRRFRPEWSVIALLFLVTPSTSTFALDPDRDLSQYTCLNWSRQNGLPGNGVNAIAQTTTVATNINATTAANGYVSNRLTDAQSQQASMTTLFSQFISNIQDTNMADAATQLSLNQTQLQAALQVTAGLNKLSLLNYLPISGAGG